MSSIQEKVDALECWYHKIDLGNGIVTPGWAPLSAEQYRIPADLTGKRVLDVGTWDGYWAFESLKRGARQVIGIDNFSDELIGSGTKRGKWENFDLCKEALGYSDDQCQRMEMDVYHAAQLGKFDIVLFLGTLYHCRHPLLALDILSSMATEALYIESAISDDYSTYRGGLGHGYGSEMVLEFYPFDEYGQNQTNWFAPTLQALTYMVKTCGWHSVKSWKLTRDPVDVGQCRGHVEARRS